jgi:hypothetical protein
MIDNDRPEDIRATAESLRKWSKLLRLPGGDFINDDLQEAATYLDHYADMLVLNGDVGSPLNPSAPGASVRARSQPE